MKRILLLGAGLVARPLVRYLLDLEGVSLTVASRTKAKADAMVAGHADGTTLALDADDGGAMAELIKSHDLAISLLPPRLHTAVAALCVEHQKHMVTTSYSTPAMRQLDGPARAAGVIIVNEVGVDPGLDHMAAMRTIDRIRDGGGQVTGFRSYCGGLPAPEANDNPFGYKFSWSPRGVLTAAANDALYLEDGKTIETPGPELFGDFHLLPVESLGELEGFPNRNSLDYIEVYGLEGVRTMYRGTLRYPGWCDTLKAIVDLGILNEKPVTYAAGTTYADYTASFLSDSASADVRTGVAAQLGLAPEAAALDNLAWLGLFETTAIPGAGQPTTALDVLSERMLETMPFRPGERDILVQVHTFDAEYPDGRRQRTTATMIDYGQADGDSSMARTVGLPAAMAVRLVIEGKIEGPGLHVPVTKQFYGPILDELESHDIGFEETTEDLP
ncbi:MAG: saccharopine dehydrogenase C-terminal domain-containing protein [Alphaproteobacteria bacterium]|jgi:saccharopine dehydrogenase (NADP+, L-glutamate forming)/spermidine synthase|nr:saccharopine dehydrogenase C-terminal domain-containing protein [Alphaproteobacteria bacterium]MDP7429707.1 saccharopine dehydrogenase C-terminal domain-containing protein [Alphaproteobacteria bacterium]|tara:strand:- start:1237 stop:2571 length:1335 start_codon:yes stop_codon:yes gene_type:complete